MYTGVRLHNTVPDTVDTVDTVGIRTRRARRCKTELYPVLY